MGYTGSMAVDPYQLRPVTEAEYPDLVGCFQTVFGEDPDEETTGHFRSLVELDRTLAAFDERDGLVASAVALSWDLTVPGAVLPAAHVTDVAVQSTHRRRGLLRRLMTRQLTDVREAGREPLAVLWASESGIYGRFGYGMATRHVTYEADTRQVGMRAQPPTGRLRMVDESDAVKELAAVYDAVRADRPGWSSRPDSAWQMFTTDVPRWREGKSRRRTVLHERDGQPTGWARWRIERGWDPAGPRYTVHVDEVVATDLGAYTDLWSFLFSIDLSRALRYGHAAVDEPLPLMLAEPRRLGTRLDDGLYVRLVDVPAALAARRYAAPVDAVLEVTDDLLPANAGRFRLRTGTGGGAPGHVPGHPATCEPTTDAADLVLDVRELGAAYLGGVPLTELALAGLVRETTPGALPAASIAFGWHRAPVAPRVF
jgi:predicted acetyltransferase